VKRVFISDCEGPISKNDNAYELTAHHVPNGDKLFTIISRYDDVLAEVVKRPGYKAGDTLKLILPFLKAYDVTDQKMEQFSAENLTLIRDAKETLRHVRSVADAYVVSTSYEHYIRAMCHALDFPCENAYCTRVQIDRYALHSEEKARLKTLAQEITVLPYFDFPPNAKSLDGLSAEAQEVVKRLDRIFYGEIAEMEIGRVYAEVNPMGGREKAEAVRDIARKLKTPLSEVMYVGDSITDEQAFALVRENGGLTLSFNGNQHAVTNAEIAVLSETSLVTAAIADAFCKLGKQHALSLAANWTREALEKSKTDQAIVRSLVRLYPRMLPKVKIVTGENMEALAEESSQFRNRVRGEAVGRLG
jgi:energy-converting hydrogenase A subunit R